MTEIDPMDADLPRPLEKGDADDVQDSHPRVRASGGRAAVLRFAVMGTELAATALVGAGIGYLIDSARSHDKAYATALGTLIGFTLGMIRFIREVNRATDKTK